jgi:hypothetical protein
VATVLGENGISIDRMRQYDHPGADAPVLIVTHKTARPNLDTALACPGTGVVAGARWRSGSRTSDGAPARRSRPADSGEVGLC